MGQFNLDRKFENDFRLAFENAEIVPAAHVWAGIDADLIKQESKNNKKWLLFFQMVAAASIIFATSIGLFNAMYKKDTREVVQKEIQTIDGLEDNIVAENNEGGKSTEMIIIPEDPEAGSVIEEKSTTKIMVDLEHDVSKDLIEKNSPKMSDIKDLRQYFPDLALEMRGPQLTVKIPEYDPQIIPFWSNVSELTEDESTIWAKAAFSLGSFKAASPLSLGFGAADEAAAQTVDDAVSYVSTTDNPGQSYSAGFGIGGKIAPKWMLEGGLSFVHSELQASTNGILESNGLIYPVYHDTFFTGEVKNVSDYTITNSLKFLSIPIKAGYQIIDKKIGWMATGGISTNFLLENSINSDLYQSYSLSSELSPYRPLSWSALLGTEVYYNFATYYQISLFPQYHIGLTGITKPGSGFEIRPNSLSVGVSLRYLLK